MIESWRDWKAWILIGITIAYPLGAWSAIVVWGGPECVNDYDPIPGYSQGCFGGVIQYNGLGGFLFLTTLAITLALPWILRILGVPRIPELIARSGWRRRQLFLWLDSG